MGDNGTRIMDNQAKEKQLIFQIHERKANLHWLQKKSKHLYPMQLDRFSFTRELERVGDFHRGFPKITIIRSLATVRQTEAIESQT